MAAGEEKIREIVDEQEVSQIVETMKKKYREEGVVIDEVNTSLKELRAIIAEDTYSKIGIETQDDVDAFDSNTTKFFGKIYLKLKKALLPFQKMLKRFPLTQEIGYYLYSANMHYSTNQYLALTVAVSFVFAVIALPIGFLAGFITKLPLLMILLPILFAIIAGFFSTIIMIMIPKQKAIARGNACSIELPFALRHMATELKAGIGLYKTLQAVTAANYGILSEEFARTLSEVEEGTDTSVALKHMALRTQSKPLKTAINHIVRTMRIGGNLSKIMSDIAKDVSAEIKDKIITFAQTMNFFSVVFIFIGIVLPVGLMILGSIRNSPIGEQTKALFASMPLTPEVMLLFYFVAMPIIFIMLNFIIYYAQPKM